MDAVSSEAHSMGSDAHLWDDADQPAPAALGRVAVLFARTDSYYKQLPECDVWDIDRDARKWRGGAPVVAHPPCRAWGKFAMFAKPRDDEKALAIWDVAQVRQFGGVLEHPAGSKLWPELGLPEPGAGRDAHYAKCPPQK